MLYFDLTKDATRKNLLAQVLAELPEEAASALLARFEDLRASTGHCHDLGEVLALIDEQGLDENVAADARRVYRILAEAEAQVHGCTVEETHFHEVGNHEAIANVLAVCQGIAELAPERIEASRVQTGYGTVECAHGTLDIPAPATKAILDRGIPLCEADREGEWCTPTSAALIYHFVEEFRL